MRFKLRSLSRMKSYHDNRHARAVKVSLNKIYENTSVLNLELSKLITSFSHCCHLTGGSFLVSPNLKFFVVQKLLSNHWCIGWFCPSKITIVDRNIRYVPNLLCRGKVVRKRINLQTFQLPTKHQYSKTKLLLTKRKGCRVQQNTVVLGHYRRIILT